MLAAGLHAQPGVYALLLGSGVSTGAGIPIGCGVVQELIRRLATATEPDDQDASNRATEDPEAWWNEHGDGNELGYSNLLSAVAPTPAARRAMLAGFFEPGGDDIDAGLKVPGPAHRAIADLAKCGLIRVILTTNFDRLIERALEDAGVPPQVASRPEDVGAGEQFALLGAPKAVLPGRGAVQFAAPPHGHSRPAYPAASFARLAVPSRPPVLETGGFDQPDLHLHPIQGRLNRCGGVSRAAGGGRATTVLDGAAEGGRGVPIEGRP